MLHVLELHVLSSYHVFTYVFSLLSAAELERVGDVDWLLGDDQAYLRGHLAVYASV